MSTTKTSAGSSQAQSSSNAAASSSSVSTKPVHPVLLSSFSPTGCELSTWAYITSSRPLEVPSCVNDDDDDDDLVLPNLVVAHSTCLKIYVVDPKSGTLILASSYENLAGTIISLDTIPFGTCNASGEHYDGLLLGFAGHPRMSIVYPATAHLDSLQANENDEWGAMGGWSGVLTASSIIDLTPALTERSWGSVAPLEQDLNCTVICNKKTPTVSVILGGGIAVATFQLPRSNNSKDVNQVDNGSSSWWRIASEPYILPLNHLSGSLQSSQKSGLTAASQQNKYAKSSGSNVTSGRVSHGFGDIISSAFLSGYTEPVLTLLHCNPYRYGGRTCPGRLGHHSTSTRNPLSLTAVSVSIDQKRSVVLWSLEDSIPSDAFQLYQHPQGGVLVVCANEILYVNCAGKIECCTAVNGWVRATASSNLRSKGAITAGLMQPNPSPLRKLSIQLDGSRLVFINKNLAVLSLRNGSIYSVELHDKKKTRFGKNSTEKMCISLSPIGKKLGGIGMVSTLSAVTLPTRCHLKNFLDDESNLDNTKKEDFENGMKPENSDDTDKEVLKQKLSLGLVFAGSRMGDSTLMMYGLKEEVDLTAGKWKRKNNEDNDDEYTDEVSNKKTKIDLNERGLKSISDGNIDDSVAVSEDEEDLLAREENALYENSYNDESIVTPIHGEGKQANENDETSSPSIYEQQVYRPQVLTLSMFQHVKVLDSLTGLGPLGTACEGPIACDRPSGVKNKIVKTPPKSIGSTMNIYPCGFGSSGGLAILTAPGLNYGSTIISEADCHGMGSIYHCPKSDYIFLLKKQSAVGCMVLQLMLNDAGEKTIVEFDLNKHFSSDSDFEVESEVPTFFNVKDILTRMTIVLIKEFVVKNKPKIMVLVQYGSAHAVAILSTKGQKLSLVHTHIIGSCDDSVSVERGDIASVVVSEMLDKRNSLNESKGLSFGCVWSSGHTSLFLLSSSKGDDFEVKEAIIEGKDEDKIVAIDMFSIADNIFQPNHKTADMKSQAFVPDEKISEGIFDEDDFELYGRDFLGEKNSMNQIKSIKGGNHPQTQLPPSRYNTLGGYVSGANLSDTNVSIIAICRQSGQMQLLDVSKLISESSSLVIQTTMESTEQAQLWKCFGGCGYGSVQLDTSENVTSASTVEDVFVSEMKFFFCGPSNSTQCGNLGVRDLSILRSLCLLIETNLGDLHLYTGSKSNGGGEVGFRRVPLRTVTRMSKEVRRHRNKLKRKGIVVETDDEKRFRPSRFHRFFSLSGQDGLFSASYHPLWFVSERGAPSALSHRLRHCAPAGGTEVLVSGFCSGLNNVGFITVHERIGKVGSQRITFFSG